jgi:hypothetical protein
MPPSTSNFASASVAPVRADRAYSSGRCSQHLTQRLEQRGPLVEGQLAQRRAADGPGVVDRRAGVDPGR